MHSQSPSTAPKLQLLPSTMPLTTPSPGFSPAETAELVAIESLRHLAKMLGEPMDPAGERLELMARHLCDLSADAVLAAVRDWANGNDELLSPEDRRKYQVGARFPTPAGLRVLANARQPDAAKQAWIWVANLIREHGADLHPKSAGFERIEHPTRPGLFAEQALPLIPAPEIPAQIAAALRELGSGKLLAGLEYVAKHPALVKYGWEDKGALYDAERIEGKFRAAYLAVGGGR